MVVTLVHLEGQQRFKSSASQLRCHTKGECRGSSESNKPAHERSPLRCRIGGESDTLSRMGTFLYFAYGSNLLFERLKERCPSAERAGLAKKPGYALGFSKRSVDGSGKGMFGLTSTPEDELMGALFALKDDEVELERLHRAEGKGNGYDYIADFQVVRIPDGTTETVRTYQMAPSHCDASLQPYDWYLALVVAGAIQSGLPMDYISRLRASPCRADAKLDRVTRVEALQALAAAGHPSIDFVLARAN